MVLRLVEGVGTHMVFGFRLQFGKDIGKRFASGRGGDMTSGDGRVVLRAPAHAELGDQGLSDDGDATAALCCSGGDVGRRIGGDGDFNRRVDDNRVGVFATCQCCGQHYGQKAEF